MSTEQGIVQTTIARKLLYQFLSDGFRPPTEQFLAQLGKDSPSFLSDLSFSAMPSLASSLNKLLRTLKEQCESGDLLSTLTQQCNDLFVGPYHLTAPPYESVYSGTRGWVMGEAATEVLRLYRSESLLLSPHYHDLPDHIATELEFMAYLTEKEGRSWTSQDLGLSLAWVQKEKQFLQEHLTRWAPEFCRRLVELNTTFYSTLAEVVTTFISMDLPYVRWLARELDEERPQ